jgi:hypothetical protein
MGGWSGSFVGIVHAVLAWKGRLRTSRSGSIRRGHAPSDESIGAQRGRRASVRAGYAWNRTRQGPAVKAGPVARQERCGSWEGPAARVRDILLRL